MILLFVLVGKSVSYFNCSQSQSYTYESHNHDNNDDSSSNNNNNNKYIQSSNKTIDSTQ